MADLTHEDRRRWAVHAAICAAMASGHPRRVQAMLALEARLSEVVSG